MMRSEKRILTTHTGSLPRPEDLLEMMRASEGGRPFDRAALPARIRGAVGEVVHRQIETGIDLVNDGEMSKPSYATYVKDRLSGFTGASGRIPGAAVVVAAAAPCMAPAVSLRQSSPAIPTTPSSKPTNAPKRPWLELPAKLLCFNWDRI